MKTALKTDDFRRYLKAKHSVEARALNSNVWGQMVEQVKKLEGQIWIIELGAGIGSMALRFLESDLLQQASYKLIDVEDNYIEGARILLIAAAQKKGFQVNVTSKDEIDLVRENINIRFRFVASEAALFLEDPDQRDKADLLIAHAFLDLINLESALAQFLGALRPKAYFYFPITYDGLTSFEPQIDAAFEAEMIALYHRTMDQRLLDGLPSGDSQTGRHLFAALEAAGGQVIAAGSSDWVVFPQRGSYVEDEAYFLFYILSTIEAALSGLAELDAARFEKWLGKRREQVEQAKLIYIAHQLDVFGQKKT